MAGSQKRPSNRTGFPPSNLSWRMARLFTMLSSSLGTRSAGLAWLCSRLQAASQGQSRAPPDQVSVINAN